MLSEIRKFSLAIFTFLLLVFVFFIFYLDLEKSNSQLKFAVLDVGQGDALFIESPSGVQVLVDAGPPKKITGSLSRIMPIFDRSIDAVIITNPDQDHIGGLIDVLETYKVGQVFEPGTSNDSSTYSDLSTKIEKQKIKRTLLKKGMRLHLGSGAWLDILFPDQDVSLFSANDGSVVARLVYGSSSILLTGDSTLKTEKIILKNNNSSDLKSNILKVGHHGSRTSTSWSFLQAVAPEYAVISNGKNNRYGHPHQEVLDDLEYFGVKTLRTDLLGTISFICDRIEGCVPLEN